MIGAEALERAQKPHARDRASFIPRLVELLTELQTESGRVEVIGHPSDGDQERLDDEPLTSSILGVGYRFHLSDGHTPGQLLIEVEGDEGPLVFCGDLIPGAPWVHLPITMGYDRFPERLIEEKSELLSDLIERGGKLFFTHDSEFACAHIKRDERGRFSALDPRAALCGEPL